MAIHRLHFVHPGARNRARPMSAPALSNINLGDHLLYLTYRSLARSNFQLQSAHLNPVLGHHSTTTMALTTSTMDCCDDESIDGVEPCRGLPPGRFLKNLGNNKASRTRRPLFVILACLTWLLIGLINLQLGLHGVIGIFEADLDAAAARYYALKDSHMQDQFVHGRLRSLLSQSLHRRSFETHKECLARAITLADAHYLDVVPYQEYPDVLNSTIDWAEDNCGKIMFSPLVHSPHLKILLRLTVTKMGDVARWVKDAGVNIVSWFADVVIRKDDVKTLGPAEDVLASQKEAQGIAHELLHMPPSFSLDCSGPVCRLSYNAPSSSSADRTTSKQKVEAAWKRVLRIETFLFGTCKSLCMVTKVFTRLLIAQAVVSIFVIVEDFSNPPCSSEHPLMDLLYQCANQVATVHCSRCIPRVRNVRLLVVQTILCVVRLGGFFATSLPDGNGIMRWLTLWYIDTFIIVGIGMVLFFLTPMPEENIGNVVDAIKELYSILRSTGDHPASRDSSSAVPLPSSDKSDQLCSPAKVSPTSSSNKPKPSPLKLSLTTTLQEDIEQVLVAMNVDSGSDIDPGSEAGSDCSLDSDTDLNSEPRSDWSVVEEDLET
ncbi:hypothetical protein CC80DRAFT_569875 [Byssothecium circinans]|uniref:Uncharacterized protein n=1 Tax=Byssothecium circinans TaxID=147558 RepID=A0A6A5UCY9_9PLEO|nr:hypothetical protein CC80DRAFT_569875 [Byssothecium circinans]